MQSLAAQRATAKPASTARPSPATSATPTVSPAELQRSIADSASAIERTLLSECNLLLSQPATTVGVSRIAPGPVNSLQSKHQQNNHITSNYERLSYERDAKLAVLANDLNTTNARVQELTAHKKRLLEQVALCDQEIGGLTTRANALTAEYSNSAHYYQQQLDQLAQTGEHPGYYNTIVTMLVHFTRALMGTNTLDMTVSFRIFLHCILGNSVRKSLQAHDQVNNLLGAVRNFESKFADVLLQQHQAAQRQAAVTAAQARGAASGAASARGTAVAAASASASGAAQVGEEEQHALLSERVLLLSGALRSYVGSEAQCIKFLSERIEAAQGKLATARKELLAYAALNMKVNPTTPMRINFLAVLASPDMRSVIR